MGKTVFKTLLLATLVAFMSCEEGEFEALPDGRDYFPIEAGRLIEYRIDSVIFDDIAGGNSLDTFTSYLRERFIDTMETAGETIAIRVEHSYRQNIVSPWEVIGFSILETDASYAYRLDGAIRLVKMRFPLRDISLWDPTQFIDPTREVQVGTEQIEMFTNWSGSVLEIGGPYQLGDLMFDNTVRCIQADDDNEIERRYVHEIYADGVGLVERVDTILDSRCKRLGDLIPCFDETWIEKGEKGYILSKKAIRIQ